MTPGDLVLLRPLWLLALLPVALAALWVRRRAASGGWERLVDPPLLRRMQALGLVGAGAAPRLAPIMLAALLALALQARPGCAPRPPPSRRWTRWC